MPIFAGALGDGDEHDVHDDDAAYDERDEGDGGEHGAEGVGDGRGELDEGVVGVELEGVFGAGFVVAGGAHEHPDFVGGGFEPGSGRAGLDVDGEGLLGAVGLLVGGEGDADEVILRGAEGAALLFDDADDGVGDTVGAELLAEGLDAGEEVFLDVGADDGDVGGVFFVGGSEIAALGDVEVLEAGICQVRPRICASVMAVVPRTSLPVTACWAPVPVQRLQFSSMYLKSE